MLNLLNSMLESSRSELKKAVLESLINKAKVCESDKEIISMVNDVMIKGCSSGIVPDMIYFYDTDSFFDTHTEEIFDLLNESIAEGLTDANNISFSKNNLAWWAYEVITSHILYELETAYELSEVE